MPDIEELKKEYQELTQKLSSPGFFKSEEFQETSKRYSTLEKIIKKHDLIAQLQKNIADSKEILEKETDEAMQKLAEDEIVELQRKLEEEINGLDELMRGKEENGKGAVNEIIMEIRAGTGGEEASLFAADLTKMYQNYGKNQEWQIELYSSQQSEHGGYKEIVFGIKGRDVFQQLKYEAGVHRVQRIPETEKSGRIHTSTASVAVLPKAKPADIAIKPEDINIEIFKSSGPGGQNVNKRMTAVRITHIPTGLVVSSQTTRTLPQNRENAMNLLRSQLLALKIEEEESKIKTERKGQIGSAERAEKIRTYNFPQDRITDHRVKKSWHNIQNIMDGDLEPIINALQGLEI